MSKYPRIFEALVLLALVVSSAAHAEGFNGTIYQLGLSRMDVTVPVKASRLNLSLPQQASNITLYDAEGRIVGVNSSYSFWRGDHNYDLVFEKYVSGELVYSMPYQGQQFILPLRHSGPVRVILPPGYLTGNHILGIARPDPDEIGIYEGRTAVTWRNVSQYQIIEVDYYPEKAPEALTRAFAILAVAGVLLLIEYYISIRKLRAVREDAEKMGKTQQ